MELCWAERAVLGMQLHTHTHTRTHTHARMTWHPLHRRVQQAAGSH